MVIQRIQALIRCGERLYSHAVQDWVGESSRDSGDIESAKEAIYGCCKSPPVFAEKYFGCERIEGSSQSYVPFYEISGGCETGQNSSARQRYVSMSRMEVSFNLQSSGYILDASDIVQWEIMFLLHIESSRGESPHESGIQDSSNIHSHSLKPSVSPPSPTVRTCDCNWNTMTGPSEIGGQ